MTDAAGWLAATVAAVDEVNSTDPRSITIGDVTGPQELVMGRRASEWVERLDEHPSAEQLVAARAHHLRRWARPRSDYPEGRSGYLRWRADAKRVHAAELAEIMTAAGASNDAIETTTSLILKVHLRTSSDAQVHEDALCLTFLEAQLDHTADRLGDDAVVDVLVKTIKKMSPAGLTAASGLALSERGLRLLTTALGHSAE